MHTKYFPKILPAGFVALIVVVLVLPACHSSDPRRPHVLIQTQAGDIEVELYPLQAPASVARFFILGGFGVL